MSAERSAAPGAAVPVVVAVLLLGLAGFVGLAASLTMWDPSETCATRGGAYLTSETILGNPLCSDGSTVQPMWMTVTTTAALLAAAVCVAIALVRHVRRGDQEEPPSAASHRS